MKRRTFLQAGAMGVAGLGRWGTRSEAAGLEASGGTFSTYLSRLSGNGLIEKDGDTIRVCDDLFIALGSAVNCGTKAPRARVELDGNRHRNASCAGHDEGQRSLRMIRTRSSGVLNMG